MYQPERYKNDDSLFIYDFIKQYPFATIVGQGKHLAATHVPVLVEGNAKEFRMYAHIANHNSMHKLLGSNTEMLLIFTGPNAYISSSWYEKPDIPTWDYSAVHINAEVKLQSAEELQHSLDR